MFKIFIKIHYTRPGVSEPSITPSPFRSVVQKNIYEGLHFTRAAARKIQSLPLSTQNGIHRRHKTV